MPHTSGPWRKQLNGFGVTAFNGECVAAVFHVNNDDGDQASNYNLISSAPDLLTMLKRYQQAAEARHNGHINSNFTITDCEIYASPSAEYPHGLTRKLDDFPPLLERCDEICACILDGSAIIAKAEGVEFPEDNK